MTRNASPAADQGSSSRTVPKSKVELRNVCKGYGDDWARQEVVENFNLTISPGTLTAVVGPSGCGKSTLVSLVAGFEMPDKGEILINDKPVEEPSHDRMVVFQESALMPWLTAYQNVVFGPKLRGDMAAEQLAAEANHILETVGLAEFKHKYPLQLSGGMQRRAELARAMINRPLLMIMDEPFRGLDAMSRELMQEFYLRLFEENRRTNLFVTSEIEEAIFLADHVVVLSSRPTTVRAVIEIDLPRPRDFHMMSSPKVYEYKHQAMEILHEEALKSFKLSGAQADFVEAYSRHNE